MADVTCQYYPVTVPGGFSGAGGPDDTRTGRSMTVWTVADGQTATQMPAGRSSGRIMDQTGLPLPTRTYGPAVLPSQKDPNPPWTPADQ